MTPLQLNIQAVHGPAFSAKNLDWFSLSLGGVAGAGGALFSSILGSIDGGNGAAAGSAAGTAPKTDPVSQLIALVQSGVPPSMIAGKIAARIVDNLQHKLGTLSRTQQDRMRTSIQRSVERELEAAVSNNSPPLPTSLGQQNELSGNLLDAIPAKDIPAQAPDKGTPSTLDVSSLVRSSIAQVLASLQQTTPGSLSANSGTLGALQKKANEPSSLPLGLASSMATQPTASATPLPQHPVPPNAPQSSSLFEAQAIAMKNAPDLLARMLVRASSTDARMNGNALTAAPQTPQMPSAPQSPQELAARFEAAIATIVNNAVASDGSSGSSNGRSGNPLDQQLSSSPTLSTHDNASPEFGLATADVSFANQVQTIAQHAPLHAPLVDANAVIEQMMKSLVMRTDEQGSSTIRLHLQPENLGDMTMHITVSGSQISANVVTANADVRSTLLSNHQQLARSLQNAGLTLSGFSVDVSGGNAGRDQNRDRTAGFGRRYVVHELHGAPTQETPALSTLAPSIMNGSNLELFNYLV